MGETVARRPCVLVVEDEAVLRLDLEDLLTEAGYDIGGPFSTVAAARQWLAQGRPDLAMLDYRLADDVTLDLARDLRRQGVPFLFYSGCYLTSIIPPDLRDVPCLEKPSPTGELIAHLTALCAAPAA